MAENKAVVLYFDRLQMFDFLSITEKGEKVQTQRTSIESVEKVALEIIADPELYSRKSISITRKSGS